MANLQIPANPQAVYTAAQLAVALRISKRAVLKCLDDCAPIGSVIIRGNEASAWRFDELPARMQENLALLASSAGLPIADYLDGAVKQWAPEVPLSGIAESSIEEARKLRSALLPAFERMDSSILTPADRVRLGIEDYQRAFGYCITERHWRRLVDRTLWRDGGAKDFQRLEIYLPERLQRVQTSAAILPNESEFCSLRSMIQSFGNPSDPNRVEKAALWAEAFELFEAKADTRRDRKQVRRLLVDFLWRHAVWLAESERGLRVAFDRKYARWVEKDRSASALLDGREQKRGVPTAPAIPDIDVDKIVWEAASNCGGRVAQAVRKFAASGYGSGLTESTVELITRPHARKSAVNRRLNDKVKGDVRAIAPFFRSQRVIDDSMAHVDRDYSKLRSMRVVNADDFTFPVYFYIPDGNGWYTLTRGQCLLMLDVRSWKVIAWSLQPERNYNSLVIRTLMNRVCATWGIPQAWYFERGIWKTSKVVKGEAPSGWSDALSWPEAKVGWENLGVQFRHAIRARTKPVERVGGLLQDRMEGLRGYCGRDERRDCPARTKQAQDDVKFHRVRHPGELFYSFDEWERELGKLIDQYNADSQDGEVLQGQSPDEAFEACWPNDDPPARMDASCWHLVSHYVKAVPVTTNGITFRIGSRKFVYRNERTGQDRGKTVLAWFDPECPDSICVTDKDRRNPYLVERASKVDFLAEQGDLDFEREIAKAAAHSSYSRARFHVLKAKFEPTFRRNMVDRETAVTGQAMLKQRETVRAQQKAETKIKAAYRENRMPLPANGRLDPEAVDDLKRLEELRRKAYSGNPVSRESQPGKKDYFLKPFKKGA